MIGPDNAELRLDKPRLGGPRAKMELVSGHHFQLIQFALQI